MNNFKKKTIKANTLGELFKRARLSRNLDIKEVEKNINIEKKYLKSIEDDDFYKLPGPTYTRGFLKRYAEFLELDPKEIVQRWEKEYDYQNKSISDNKKKNKETKRVKKFLTRFNFKIVFIPIILLLILLYLGLSIKNVLLPPQIKVLYPPQEFVTKNSSLLIQGKTNAQAEVFINKQLIERKGGLIFEQEITLLSGLNIIQVSAKKKYSKKRIVLLKVVLED